MSWVGTSLRRKEDERLIRGHGLFTDDELGAGMLHLYILRSPYAHARILSIDTTEAEALPGVVCVLTGKDIAEQCDPFMQLGPEPCDKIRDLPLAIDKVIFQGEPVAAIAATSPALAMDAGQLINVDYEMLDAVVDAEEALTDKIILHEAAGTNRTWHGVYEYGDVEQAFRDAAHVVRIPHLHFHRYASTPLEGSACVAEWTRQGTVDFLCNNSFPGFAQQLLAPGLRLKVDQVRIRTYDIGGSFGNKIWNYVYMALAALASKKAGGRRVKWAELRTEHMLAGGHGNERTFRDTEVALDKQGVITAVRSRHIDDCGAYTRYEPLGCVIWSQVLPATYKLRNIRIDFTQAVTNKCPVVPNRGYSRMQQLWFMERIVDICAHELRIPADEMRLRNYITEFPYETPNGCVYDSGNYPAMLAKARQLVDWDKWQKLQVAARAEGRLIGIGIGTTLDSGTNNFGQAQIMNQHLPFSGNAEVCTMRLDFDGALIVCLGTGPSGQGHETATSQVVADELGIDPSMVQVRPGFDTAWNTFVGHSGTYASQFAVTGLSAVHGACQKMKAEMRKLAAFLLEASGRPAGVRHRCAGPGSAGSRHRQGSRLLAAEQRHQQQQCDAGCEPGRCDAQHPPRVPSAVQRAGYEAQVWQSHADLCRPAAHRCYRGESRNLQSADSRLCGSGRLRHRHQSADRCRPGAWRHQSRHRCGADGELQLRRDRQSADQYLQRLLPDHLAEHPGHHLRQHPDALTVQLQRREGYG